MEENKSNIISDSNNDNKNVEFKQEPAAKPKVAVSFDKAFDTSTYKNGSFTKSFVSWERLIPVLQLAIGTTEKPKGIVIDKDGIDVIIK